MFHCPVGVWVIEQHAIILRATVRSPTVYLYQCWYTANWTPRDKFQWNLNRNSYIFIHENAFGNKMSSGKWRQFCLGLNVLISMKTQTLTSMDAANGSLTPIFSASLMAAASAMTTGWAAGVTPNLSVTAYSQIATWSSHWCIWLNSVG